MSLPVPQMRPCCALGHSLRPSLGPIRAPIVFGNIVGVEALSTHIVSGRPLLSERNGLIYTCKGGFIDTAHLRSAADWTAYLAERIEALLPAGGSFLVPSQIVPVSLIVQRQGPSLSTPAMRDLAIAIASRAAFDLAAWHEVMTWHGFGTASFFPERASAFSPEDLYSDLLGALVAARTLRGRKPYESTIPQALGRAVLSLGALFPQDTRRALDAVAGLWWSARRALPDERLLLRRHYSVGPLISPWRVEAPSIEGRCGELFPGGRGAADLHVPTTSSLGLPLGNAYDLQWTPSPKLAAALGHGHPVQGGPPIITQRDLPVLATAARNLGRSSPTPGRQHGLRAQNPWPTQTTALDNRIRFLVLSAGAAGWGRAEAASSAGPRNLRAHSDGAISLLGGGVQAHGGDLAIARMSVSGLGRGGDAVAAIVGAASDALFLCDNADGDGVHGPVLSWVQRCGSMRWLGMGGRLGQLRSDVRGDALLFRPLSLHVALNPLNNAFTSHYLAKRVLFLAGASLDAARLRSSAKPTGATRSGSWQRHAVAAVSAYLADRHGRASVELRAGLQQDFVERQARLYEGQLVLGLRRGFFDGPAARPASLWATVGARLTLGALRKAGRFAGQPYGVTWVPFKALTHPGLTVLFVTFTLQWASERLTL